MSIKTLGNLIQIKRYEQRLTLWQLALKMGIATSTVRAWERDKRVPNENQRQMVASILAFDSGVKFNVPI